MEIKKLEKKTLFLFKRKSISGLSREQMRLIKGGDSTTTNEGDPPKPSTLPGCVENKPTTTVSLSL